MIATIRRLLALAELPREGGGPDDVGVRLVAGEVQAFEGGVAEVAEASLEAVDDGLEVGAGGLAAEVVDGESLGPVAG